MHMLYYVQSSPWHLYKSNLTPAHLLIYRGQRYIRLGMYGGKLLCLMNDSTLSTEHSAIYKLHIRINLLVLNNSSFTYRYKVFWYFISLCHFIYFKIYLLSFLISDAVLGVKKVL